MPVALQRWFNAPVAEVWRCWTDPDYLARWFGSDPQGVVLHAETHLHRGGRFEVTFRDSDGTSHTCFGTYEAVQPPERLGFTWQWKSEPGNESRVSIALTESNGGTLMHFQHLDLDAPSAHDYAAGWSRTFDKLERALTVRPRRCEER